MKQALNKQLMDMKRSFVMSGDNPGNGRNNPNIVHQQQAHTQVHQSAPMQVQEILELCPVHEKPRELICITCNTEVCHTCALFGDHKGHDVRERSETMREIEVRTEVLMEMFEQMDQEVEKLQQDTNW
jgi:hypothetical protein